MTVILGDAGLLLNHQSASATSVFNSEAEAANAVPDLTNPRVLSWADLVPDGESGFVLPHRGEDLFEMQLSPFMPSETGRISGPMTILTLPPVAASARQDLADQAVQIAGYMTPLDVEQGKTRTFLLVPYVGACIHVPAPPSNQIVLVETHEPIEVREMWEPFEAVGTLRVKSASTDLAEVSYTMELDRIEEYNDDRGTAN